MEAGLSTYVRYPRKIYKMKLININPNYTEEYVRHHIEERLRRSYRYYDNRHIETQIK
jgi:hypothetical protein